MLKWSNKHDWFLNINSLNLYKLLISVTKCSTTQLPWASLNDHPATVSSSSVPGRNKEMLQVTSTYINTGQTEHSNQLAVKLSVVPWRVTPKESILHCGWECEECLCTCWVMFTLVAVHLSDQPCCPVMKPEQKIKVSRDSLQKEVERNLYCSLFSFKNCFTFSSTKEECVYKTLRSWWIFPSRHLMNRNALFSSCSVLLQCWAFYSDKVKTFICSWPQCLICCLFCFFF